MLVIVLSLSIDELVALLLRGHPHVRSSLCQGRCRKLITHWSKKVVTGGREGITNKYKLVTPYMDGPNLRQKVCMWECEWSEKSFDVAFQNLCNFRINFSHYLHFMFHT